jgi:synapsin
MKEKNFEQIIIKKEDETKPTTNNTKTNTKTEKEEEEETFFLLIFSSNETNFFNLFSEIKTIQIGKKTFKFKMDQAFFKDISGLTNYEGNKLYIELSKSVNPFLGTPQETNRVVKPDFIVFRNNFRGNFEHDYRNYLLGIIYSGVPTINSAISVYNCLEKSNIFGELKKIEKKLGKKNFPLIEQYYYANYRSLIITPGYPCVIKVAHLHAGFGKAVVENSEKMEDAKSLISVHEDYICVCFFKFFIFLFF